MKTLQMVLFLFVLSSTSPAWANDYLSLQTRAEEARSAKPSVDEARQELTQIILALSAEWLGTRWGLGLPQSSTPQEGKINCGTFVGTLLVHAGFDVNHKKLQRQPAELIIKTFAGKRDIKRFRNRSMDAFLDGVREMGDGLYIIGLDFHVGYLLVEGKSVRFIHASYVTKTVVNEDAETAEPIVTSKYRVVGRLLTDKTVESWLAQERIKVKGSW
jgi:hypothetical protein